MKTYADIRDQAHAKIAERRRMNRLIESLGADPSDWAGYRSVDEIVAFVEKHTAQGYDTFVKPFGSRAKLHEHLAAARKAL